jgi:hypothetical protein
LPGRDMGPDDDAGRWYHGSILTLPLAVVEAGPNAIKALWNTEERARQEQSEAWERAQYEKLRDKFAVAESP